MKKPSEVLPYSTDRTAAFLVWDLMIARGWFPSCRLNDFAGTWEVIFNQKKPTRFVYEEPPKWAIVLAPTIPEGICRAALDACGVDVILSPWAAAIDIREDFTKKDQRLR